LPGQSLGGKAESAMQAPDDQRANHIRFPSQMKPEAPLEKARQQLHNVPSAITEVYLAEDHLNSADQVRYEREFVDFFNE
jgi:hypothetical protein